MALVRVLVPVLGLYVLGQVDDDRDMSAAVIRTSQTMYSSWKVPSRAFSMASNLSASR